MLPLGLGMGGLGRFDGGGAVGDARLQGAFRGRGADNGEDCGDGADVDISALGDVFITATGDLDGDGFTAIITYFHTDPNGNTCVSAINANPPPINPNTGNPVLNAPGLIPVGPGSDDY